MTKDLEMWLKFLPLIGAVVAFSWGIYQYVDTQTSQAEIRKIEARKPFLERQLKLYTEATQVASKIANCDDCPEMTKIKNRFWELYYGELALVEDRRVESAMVQFGEKLKGKDVVKLVDGKKVNLSLRSLSLALSHACRDSLADSWGVADWRNPHANMPR